MVARGKEGGEWAKKAEGDQEIQTSSYIINIWDIMYSII